jgi:hypothetical protein
MLGNTRFDLDLLEINRTGLENDKNDISIIESIHFIASSGFEFASSKISSLFSSNQLNVFLTPVNFGNPGLY